MKARKTFNLYNVSQARNVLFGIATLWIGLFHSEHLSITRYTDFKPIVDGFKLLLKTGNVGVDIFLFLSGIGLFFSFTKDSRVRTFWKKRLMRILPTAILIATVIFSFRYVNGRYTTGVGQYITRMTFVHFFIYGERIFWFISLILVLYLLFPILYKVIDRFRIFGMLGLVALIVAATFTVRTFAPETYSHIEIALCRIPVFIIGIWAGRFVMEKKEISRWWLLLCLAVTAGIMWFMFNYGKIIKILVPGYTKDVETMYMWIYRYLSCPLAIALTLLLSFICIAIRERGRLNVLRNFFEFVGMYSMEYYMIYLNINHYLERIYDVTAKLQPMMCFGSFVVSLALCVVSRKICDYFMDYMQRKPKNWDEIKQRRKEKKRLKAK